jgi:hypothetical protein
MSIKLNKRGDLPIIILVIGVITICGLAIFSFITSDKLGRTDDLGIELFEEINSKVEKFNLYVGIGDSIDVAAKKINANVTKQQLIIEKNNNVLSIKYFKNLN